MTNLLRSIGFSVLVGTLMPVLPACGGADAETGDEQNATQTAGRFETFVGDDGQHYFQLLAGNGERVLRSEGYTTLANAKKGIASVKKNGLVKGNYQLLSAANGESYFNLVSADNGQIVGTSETYATKSNATRAIKTTMALLQKPTDKPAPTGEPKFETFTGQDKGQYFRLRAANGEIVLQSEGYSSKSAAEAGIDAVSEHGVEATAYEILEAQNGQYYFRVVAPNHEIVARGETYASKSNAERGADNVREILRALSGGNGSDAEVQQAIEAAAEGAMYVSETDSPFEYVFAELGSGDTEVDEALVREHLAKYVDENEAADGPMSDLVSMNTAFTEWKSDHAACSEDEFPGPEECAQLRELDDALEANLTDLRVFYFGRDGEPGNVEGVAVTIFIVGRTPSGNLAGVRTLAVWT